MNNYQSIPFKDEDGKEKEFYVLEQTTLNGFHYLLVEDGSADADDEEVEVLIIEAEMSQWKEQDEDVLTYALFPQVATEFFKYRAAQENKIDPAKADVKNGAYPV